MKKNKELTTRIYNNLLERIAEILNQARTKVIREINKAQVLAYWAIGREIIEFEQKGKIRAEYGEELLKKLSADMTAKFGRGFFSFQSSKYAALLPCISKMPDTVWQIFRKSKIRDSVS